jgi:hypothetical protein
MHNLINNILKFAVTQGQIPGNTDGLSFRIASGTKQVRY